MQKHEYISTLNLFESQDMFKLIKNYAKIKKYKKNKYIFMIRDTVEYIYIVKSGIVVTYGIDKHYNEKIFFLFTQGDFINDDSLGSNEFSYSCYAFNDCELYYIEKQVFANLVSNNNNLLNYILQSNSNKFSRLYRQLKNSNTFSTIDKKLCSKLWKLSRDFGTITSEGIEIDISINVVFLSKMLGSTRESVSRAIKKLCEQGILKINKRKIIIKDLNKLIRHIKS
ncbi:MAG: Crp/Fnr family transcriptional regulator [Bacilli bacterium]